MLEKEIRHKEQRSADEPPVGRFICTPLLFVPDYYLIAPAMA